MEETTIMRYQDFRDYIVSETNKYRLPRKYEKYFRQWINIHYNFRPVALKEWVNRLAEFKVGLSEVKVMSRQ